MSKNINFGNSRSNQLRLVFKSCAIATLKDSCGSGGAILQKLIGQLLMTVFYGDMVTYMMTRTVLGQAIIRILKIHLPKQHQYDYEIENAFDGKYSDRQTARDPNEQRAVQTEKRAREIEGIPKRTTYD
ncbi:hypothetical protein [Chryseobacterium salivictor]|uniref:Uncharacterized protein n=1 Tax=Chryseobacterium salivictor TaxID=2547600 RepID=A0A4P6ZDZ3_9FLAO|nr:hypothetical protein [Chryseobacterium salivictor]QBO57612.1 hypothetical protein NBC122_00777 [Chryseobacterium salivictor]